MSTWLRALFMIAALAVSAGTAHAANPIDKLKQGPKVGARVAIDIKVPDQNNQHRDFKSLAHKRGLIVLFSRSLDW